MSGEQSPVCLLLFMLFIIYLNQSIQQHSKTFLLTKNEEKLVQQTLYNFRFVIR